MRHAIRPAVRSLTVAIATLLLAAPLHAQRGAPRDTALARRRDSLEKVLESIAVVDRKLMIPMRDGVRMQFDVYRPKNVAKAPAVFVRTPYQMNFWDIALGAPADMTQQIDAVRRGYAWVGANERGHFFSEGNYDILGPPTTDGYDEIQWISTRPWSNGKVGLIGCSSTAEWQMAVAATAPKGLGAIIPQGFGAGVGRVAPYFEQGNWYRGGAVQMLFIDWLMGEQNQVRPQLPKNATQADLIRAAKSFDLAQHSPPVDWAANFSHLPEQDLIQNVGGPHGVFADSMPGIATGGAMIKRAPNDPAWYKGGLFHDNMKINVPGLWFMSWYDVSVGPNLATYNHVRKTASPDIANKQYAVIAPTLHCSYTRATENTIVGERSVGDARLDYAALTWGWFDMFLKGENNHLLDTLPKVRYYTMGMNKWQTSDTWPPKGAQSLTYFLSSDGHANSLNGDGKLTTSAPASDKPDAFEYDPMHPVTSHGGNVCCQGNALNGGSLDQKEMEQRPDILVYTTDPLKEGMEISGPMEFTVYVSSDRKDTDVTVKVMDVYPDGRAYNLDETIQRLRYRNGYDKPLAWLTPGQTVKVALQPMTTSNFFEAGHRIRIEVSSSNFPRFDRNMNTGGKNYDETTGLVAHNVVHHSSEFPSTLKLTVVKKGRAGPLIMAHFPGESAEYREAREILLRAEMDLRQQTETVALMRRALPLGGVLKQDYVFTAMDETSVRLSDLFLPGKDDLVVYSYMYGPVMKSPCASCTSILDGLDGEAAHITQRVALAVVAKSPAPRIREVQQSRGWRHLRLLSSAGTTYNADYLGEDAKGAQMPMLNVFTRRDGVVYHTYGSELLYAPHPEGVDGRHVDAIWPLWNMFDYTPSGRGATWNPKLAY